MFLLCFISEFGIYLSCTNSGILQLSSDGNAVLFFHEDI